MDAVPLLLFASNSRSTPHLTQEYFYDRQQKTIMLSQFDNVRSGHHKYAIRILFRHDRLGSPGILTMTSRKQSRTANISMDTQARCHAAQGAASQSTGRDQSCALVKYRNDQPQRQSGSTLAATRSACQAGCTARSRRAVHHNLPLLYQSRNHCSAHAPSRTMHRHAMRAVCKTRTVSIHHRDESGNVPKRARWRPWKNRDVRPGPGYW